MIHLCFSPVHDKPGPLKSLKIPLLHFQMDSVSSGGNSSGHSSHEPGNEPNWHRHRNLNSDRNTSYYTSRIRCGGCQKWLPSKESLNKHIKGKGPKSLCSTWHEDIYQAERSARLAESMQERTRRRQALGAYSRAGQRRMEVEEGKVDI